MNMQFLMALCLIYAKAYGIFNKTTAKQAVFSDASQLAAGQFISQVAL